MKNSIRFFFAVLISSLALASCVKPEEIENLQNQINEIKQENIASIESQIKAISSSITKLETTDKELKGYIETLQTQQTELVKADEALTKSIADLRTELLVKVSEEKTAILLFLEDYKAEIEGSLAVINSQIQNLQTKDEDLQTQIVNLKSYVDTELKNTKDWATATFATIEQYNSVCTTVAGIQADITSINETIAALQLKTAQDKTELEGKISELDEKTAQALQTAISQLNTTIVTAKEELTAAYTSAIATAISALESSLKTWVNNQLTGYYTIAQVDALLSSLESGMNTRLNTQKEYLEGLLTALQKTVDDNNKDTQEKIEAIKTQINAIEETISANSAAIEQLKADLATAKSDITAAYTKAIADAISTSEGKLTGQIAEAVNSINKKIDDEIAAVKKSIADIQKALSDLTARVDDLEDRIDLLEQMEIVKDVTYISDIPTYSDGKSAVWYYREVDGKIKGDKDTLYFKILPTGTVDKLLKATDIKFEIEGAYNTMVKSSPELVKLPVVATSGDGDVLTLVCSGENLKESFYLEKEGLASQLIISVGGVQKMSDYIQMRPAISPRVYVKKAELSLFVGGSKMIETVSYPENYPVKYSSNNPNVASVTENGKVIGMGVGNATITATTAGTSFTQNINVSVEASTLPVNLSEDGTANCYIVFVAGNFMFNAKVMGSSTTPLGGTPVSAEVLWESFGTDVAPSVGDLVSSVSYSDGYISFSASSLKGNAVIAAKDASGDILWSWHIWLTDLPVDQVYNNNAGTMMDRNLGATSATPGNVHALGLLYQWGRKDPFLSGNSISSNTRAASTITWPSTVSSNFEIDYATAHPTTFIKGSSVSNADWLNSGSFTDNTRWQTSDKTKGLYDPCPAGYRVPDGGDDGVWAKAFGTSSYWKTGSNWDATNRGMDFGKTDMRLGSGTIWYPAAGGLDYKYGSLYGVGSYGYYWTCTPDSYLAYSLSFTYNGYVYPSSNAYRAEGQSVRCVKED